MFTEGDETGGKHNHSVDRDNPKDRVQIYLLYTVQMVVYCTYWADCPLFIPGSTVGTHFDSSGVKSSVELVAVLVIISSKSRFLLPADPNVSFAVTKTFGVARP